MTGLATLAHTVSAPPPFNGLFYATAATIIPVLFLAIAVQGRGYESLLKVLVTMGRLAHRGVWYQAAAASSPAPW